MATLLNRLFMVSLLLGLLAGPGSLKAQDIPEPPEPPEIRLMLSPALSMGLDVVYLSDLDLLDKDVAEYLFDVVIDNVIQDWENTRLEIRIVQDAEPLATVRSNRFLLPMPIPPTLPDMPDYRGSNIDLLTGGTFPGSDIVLEFSKTLHSLDEEIENEYFRSGRLYRGIYILEAVLENDEWGPEEVMSQVRIVITNPSLIFLQHPRHRDLVHTEFPLFQFESDASDFEVFVYKRLRETDDLETVLSGHATMHYATAEKQFSYAVTDGDPLESGATYFWYVKAIVHTSHGLEEFQSEVWQFTVDTEDVELLEVDIGVLLEPVLGKRAERLARQLTGYGLRTISLNGAVITLEELRLAIEEYAGKNIRVSDVVLR